MSIRDEIEALTRKDGLIHAEDIVNWARTHPESELHKRFPWDVEQAAYLHWLSVARRLIQVYVVDTRGDRTTFSLVTDRVSGGGYRDSQQVLDNTEFRRQAAEQALVEVRHWRERNAAISELDAIFTAIDEFELPPRRPPSPRRRRGAEERVSAS